MVLICNLLLFTISVQCLNTVKRNRYFFYVFLRSINIKILLILLLKLSKHSLLLIIDRSSAMVNPIIHGLPLISILAMYSLRLSIFDHTNAEDKCPIHHHSDTHHCFMLKPVHYELCLYFFHP